MEAHAFFRFRRSDGGFVFFFGTLEGVLRDTNDGKSFGWSELSDLYEVTIEEVRDAAPDELSAKAIDYALEHPVPNGSFKLFDTEE